MPAAHAAEAASATELTTNVISWPQLEAATQSVASTTQRELAKVDFLLEQARAGRLLDATAIDAAVVDGIATVWEKGNVVDNVRVDTLRKPDGEEIEQDVAIQTHPADATAEDSAASSTNLGLETLESFSGATWLSGYCTTTGQADHKNKLTSCYQKYRLSTSTSTRDYFYYNRWATAVGEDISWAPDYQTTRVDVRSRPWTGGTGAGSGVASLTNYWPKAAQNNCSTHSFTVSYGAFSGTVPIQDCEELTPSPDATVKSMRILYDQGSVFNGRVHGADMSLIYATFKGSNPSYADYSYAKFCRNTYADCTGIARADSGW